MKRLLLLFLLAGVCMPLNMRAQAPKKVSIEGTVTEYDTKEPIAGCVVSIPTLELWVVTDAEGRFRMPSVTTGSYTIEAACLGYEALSYKVTVTNPIPSLSLRLKVSSLQLNTVTVTARKGRSLNSSSTIDRQAMDHLQATSVKDVMQLLPGVLTANPDLTTSKYNNIAIRDLAASSAKEVSPLNSSSVGIYLDGAVVNNNALLVGEKASGFGQSTDRGIDMRTISTDNIESVEVVRGVASAEYGNMSAGAVIIKTKQGRTPYEVRVKTVPNTKAVALTKGFALGPDRGFLNVGLDYANANKDLRTMEDAYNRGTFSLNYSNTFNRSRTPLKLNLKVSGYLSQGSTKPDPDNVAQEERKFLDDKSLSLNFNGSWLLNKPWITVLKYVLSHTMTREYARDRSLPDAGSYPNPGSFEDGEYLAEYTPEQFISDIRNLSMAYYTNAKLMAELSGRYGRVYNKAMIGLEWNNSGNTGRGMYYEGTRPEKFRPEPFSDIPFMNQLAAFAEEKVTLPIGKTSFTLQAGARFMWMDTDALDTDWAVDPRLNAKYTVLQRRSGKGVRELSFRGGWGIQTTMPSLRHLYPFPVYKDVSSLSWGGTETLAPVTAFTTVVTPRSELSNRGLKMQRSTNIEAGIDFELFGIRGGVTYFNEKMRRGYSIVEDPSLFTFREYKYDGDRTPEYIDDPNNPGGKVLGVDGKPLEYEEVTYFQNNKKPGNGNRYDKWGIEYTIDFGQIRPLRTSIVVNGAYMEMDALNNADEQICAAYSSNSKVMINGRNVYNPVFAAYVGSRSGVSVGTHRERLNSNVSFITHIPKLRLITSLTVQCVWIDRDNYIQSSQTYYLDDDGNRVTAGFDKGIGEREFRVDPVRFLAADGRMYDFDPAYYDDETYGNAFLSYRLSNVNGNYFMRNSRKPYFMANIRITKEIGDIAQISFYANNFTNSHPRRQNRATGQYMRMNSDLYFGAELKFKF